MPDFECRLKKYRLLKEMTQEDLAVQVGVRRETIMRLEKAQYNPSLKLAVDISRAGYTNRRYFYLSNRIKAELSFCNATIFHDSTFNVTVDTSCNFGIIL